ncbi:hypothetical protein FACS1894169_06280 [Bacteroidia bacterium]|nr:hypothetical protein FACS1894169_06280 [Bacteroidia bacterium]
MKYRLFFLLLLLLAAVGLGAQTPSPGGVTSPEVWFKSVPQTADMQGRYLWRDFAGDSTVLRLYDSRGPLYGSEYTLLRTQVRTYNFNPAMDLSEVSAAKQFLINKTNLSQATIISVWGPDYGAFDQDMFLYVLNGRPGQGYIFTKDKFIHSNESSRGIFDYGSQYGYDLLYKASSPEPTVNKFRERSLRVTTYARALQPNTSLWGEKDKAVIGIGEIFHPAYPVNTSTFNTSALNNRAFYGYTPEFIIYNRVLTPMERRRAETYLAVKYGLTLDMSYIGSREQLLWDTDANRGFNTRVTGYGRDGLSGLYQKNATTSYEEAPYYSEAYGNLYDSFDGNNSYNQPNRYRLLVIGRQEASPIGEGNYALFGDNDQPLAASTIEGANGIRLMGRRWLLGTNMEPAGHQGQTIEWNTQNLDVYTEGFKTKAVKAGSSAETSGSLVTRTPLLEKDGYFSWTITSTRRGPLTVKFGTNNPQVTSGSNDYGYYMSYAGLVYKIIKGVRQTTAIATVYTNQKIEVGKDGNTVYLRVNGTRLYTYNIEIDPADENNTYYGSILIDKYNNDDITLSDIRYGGFSDTGNKLELSYITQRASEFSSYRTGGKSYLVIDRTGTGDFSSPDVEYIPADDLDESRYKIIFNNIFWDSDGNGKDMFTFGYRQSNLVAVVTQKSPECIDEVLQQNGQVNIKIKQGFKAFTYSLINKDTREEQKGMFFEDSLGIKNLAAGTYDLTLAEAGGFNLYAKQAGNYVNKALASTYFNSTANAWLEWTVAANTRAMAGMKTSASLQSNPGTMTIGYGLSCDNGQLYRIEGGAVSTVPLASTTPGDRIRVERVANKIYYKLNEVEIYSLDIPTADRLAYNYAVAEVFSGGIYNLKFNRMAATATWVVTDNLALESSSGDSFLQTVVLEVDCYAQPVAVQQQARADHNARLSVMSTAGTYTIKAALSLDTPQAVTFVAYDLAGNPASKKDNTSPQAEQQAELTVQRGGVYIVKAITANGEYTQKAIVQ